jgi:hypothetical protein
MTKFLLAIAATLSLSANASVITGNVGVGISDDGVRLHVVQSYDAFTFSLLGDTSVTFDLGGSANLYGTDGYLTLFQGVGVDANALTANYMDNDDWGSAAGRIAAGWDSLDSLITGTLAAGDYTLFVHRCCEQPGSAYIGLDTVDIIWVDATTVPSAHEVSYGPTGYRLTYAGASLTKVAQVPEPSIIALFGLGLVGIGFARRRQS